MCCIIRTRFDDYLKSMDAFTSLLTNAADRFQHSNKIELFYISDSSTPRSKYPLTSLTASYPYVQVCVVGSLHWFELSIYGSPRTSALDAASLAACSGPSAKCHSFPFVRLAFCI